MAYRNTNKSYGPAHEEFDDDGNLVYGTYPDGSSVENYYVDGELVRTVDHYSNGITETEIFYH